VKNFGYKPLIAGLISLALVTGTYLLGYSVGHQNLQFDNGYKPTVTNWNLGRPRDIDFNLFWDVWDRVNKRFVGKIDNQEMVYDAIKGALGSLDDPYTLFLSPEEAKRFHEDLEGSFSGIGAEIENRNGAITILTPLADTPAMKAGLRPKDVIVKIDDKTTEGMLVNDAIKLIRGDKGTTVKLTIAREGEAALLEISVVRDVILIRSVSWEIKADNIGYIKVNQFGDDTNKLFRQALDEMIAKKPKGLIVDMRNNPGGYLDTAVDMSSYFLKDRGSIVKQKDKHGQILDIKATNNPIYTEAPMIVLVNGSSASASEIFAGAMQDYGRARLVGEKTFGKGSVQELQDIGNGAAVRITVAKWLTPKDRAIDKEGIKPDVEVKLTDEDYTAGRDPQLDKAMELLK
jgi:carboxyl-terminal processing protease